VNECGSETCEWGKKNCKKGERAEVALFGVDMKAVLREDESCTMLYPPFQMFGSKSTSSPGGGVGRKVYISTTPVKYTPTYTSTTPGRGGLLTPGRSHLLSPSSPAQAEAGGISCCWGACTFCTCGSISVLSSPTGLVKLGEVFLSVICHLLLLNYGMEKEARDLGIGLSLSLSASSSSLSTAALLLLSYTLSSATYDRVRPSLFEVAYNLVACGVYIGASSLLATQVYLQLLYYYRVIPGFSLYPALTAAYVLGYAAGVLHGIDALMALKFMRTMRATL